MAVTAFGKQLWADEHQIVETKAGRSLYREIIPFFVEMGCEAFYTNILSIACAESGQMERNCAVFRMASGMTVRVTAW